MTQLAPSVDTFVSTLNFWTEWPWLFACMGHDYSSPGIEDQQSRSQAKIRSVWQPLKSGNVLIGSAMQVGLLQSWGTAHCSIDVICACTSSRRSLTIFPDHPAFSRLSPRWWGLLLAIRGHRMYITVIQVPHTVLVYWHVCSHAPHSCCTLHSPPAPLIMLQCVLSLFSLFVWPWKQFLCWNVMSTKKIILCEESYTL